jgi:hypothetical protein
VGEQRTGRPPGGAATAPLEGGTLGFLLGDWNVARQVLDFRAGRSGSFRGKASFVPAAGGADRAEIASGREPVNYREDGEFSFGEHRGPAFRRLIYRARQDGGADVQFADGREFFRLDISAGTCQADHPCREDSYHVTVARLGPDRFTETWRVTGPEKDYEMTATYTRTGSSPGRAA